MLRPSGTTTFHRKEDREVLLAAAPERRTGSLSLVLVLGLAAMVVSMMQTLVIPILGIIQNDLGATTAQVSWVTTATLLSAAVFTPLLGGSATSAARSRRCSACWW